MLARELQRFLLVLLISLCQIGALIADNVGDRFLIEALLAQQPKRAGKTQKHGTVPVERLPRHFNHSSLHEWLMRRAVYVLDAHDSSDGESENTAAHQAPEMPQVAPCNIWVSCAGAAVQQQPQQQQPQVVLVVPSTEHWLLEVLGGSCAERIANSRKRQPRKRGGGDGGGSDANGGGLCFEPLVSAYPEATPEQLEVRVTYSAVAG